MENDRGAALEDWFERFCAEYGDDFTQSDEDTFVGYMLINTHDNGDMSTAIDVENQIIAIRTVMDAAKASEQALREEIQALLALQNPTSRDEDDYPFYCMLSIYRSAAINMATAGMKAGLIEAVLVAFLQKLGKDYGAKLRNIRPEYIRWAKLPGDKRAFSPKEAYEGEEGKSTYKRAFEILENVGLTIPEADKALFGVLYNYRNNMLHNAMEWPEDIIKSFERKINSYPSEYFTFATSDGVTKIIYLGQPFLDEVDRATTDVCRAMGAFLKTL